MQMTMRFAVQSFAGRRSNNEDAAFAGPRLLALADGMGGHAAGEIAATIAVAELLPLNETPPLHPVGELRAAFHRANATIAEHSIRAPATEGMGTTLTALLFDGSRLALGHVGDSRAYLFRDGELTQITRDDSIVQGMVDDGTLTEEQALHHPQRALVTKVLTGRSVDPHVELRSVERDDRYLICSDGLTDYVSNEVIADTLRMKDPIRCPQELIRAALRHQTQDNITCIVADVIEGDCGYDVAVLTGAPGHRATVVRV